MNDSKNSPRLVWSLLAVIIVAGGWFRFWHLGVPAFRADTILFWQPANRDVALSDLITKWFAGSSARCPWRASV